MPAMIFSALCSTGLRAGARRAGPSAKPGTPLPCGVVQLLPGMVCQVISPCHVKIWKTFWLMTIYQQGQDHCCYQQIQGRNVENADEGATGPEGLFPLALGSPWVSYPHQEDPGWVG